MIFFVGDGMGVSTLTAARILKGQRQKLVGPERALLSFEVRSGDNNSIPFEISRRSPTSASCARTAWTARWPTPRARRPPTLAASRTTSAPSGCLGGSSTSSARVRHFQRIRQSLQLDDTLKKNITYKDWRIKVHQQVHSILTLAQASGFATGIVTSDRITGASPAAAYRSEKGIY